mmetsp:Transcript_45219/g.120279  ORF Transcript_45219/g.120279 Transcript_45219/m.120279 type:complete len:86 (-) Transcript_45219:110-367(-)
MLLHEVTFILVVHSINSNTTDAFQSGPAAAKERSANPAVPNPAVPARRPVSWEQLSAMNQFLLAGPSVVQYVLQNVSPPRTSRAA